MSNDQFVSLPADVLAGGQKLEVVHLLAAIARFGAPGTFPPGAGTGLERDLEARFSAVQDIGLPDATAWLSQVGITPVPLDAQVAALASGDSETLHQALQSGNDAQSIQLLAISDASKLIELEDSGEVQLSPRNLWSKADSCLLLRYGYNTQSEYAYYAASLPGDSRRPIRLSWSSIVHAGVSAAVAILPPPRPVDMERAKTSLHIMHQALATAASALADHLDALGQSLPPDASVSAAVTEQAV